MQRGHWIFAYGSLVWRPAFGYLRRLPAWLTGWERRFWQGSPDHRGTPSAPGRVVTLVATPGGRCGGVAYRIGKAEFAATMVALDRREQGGYERRRVTVQTAAGDIDALVYLATPANPNWLGPATDRQIAAHIAAAAGPSGANAEYLFRLSAALRELGVTDPHVAKLESLLNDRAGTG